jgi:hypothetical protein
VELLLSLIAMYLFVIFICYKLGRLTILRWDGPTTLIVNDLAKNENDNDVRLLALAELKRLVARRADPPASEVVVNWRQRISDPPGTQPWHLFVRQIFSVAFSETEINDSGWRDQYWVWVGQIYISKQSATDATPLLLFLFENKPSSVDLDERISAYVNSGASIVGAKLYAIYYEDNNNSDVTSGHVGYDVVVLSQKQLLRMGLKLNNYVRDLLKRFNEDKLGGTNATLRDTFVEPHVQTRGDPARCSLSNVLSSWLEDSSRRQLAITAEYGRGKSTAMLKFCADWAMRYGWSNASEQRIPLLIELRGQNPGESDPLTFISAWAARYALNPKQILNLIEAGGAILIFEGFDELRHAGRAYDRHEHFNALWRMAYPGTKVIFTGRPNFFIDDDEKNLTLRTSEAGVYAHTQLWELLPLTMDEVREVAGGFGKQLGMSIAEAASNDASFFDIVSRPSMLPVVATIWSKIEDLRRRGHEFTSAILLEHYIRATYDRKEEELRQDQFKRKAPEGTSYLILPREVRELLTTVVVWRMAVAESRNTIRREVFNEIIRSSYDGVLQITQARGVNAEIAKSMRAFEERFKEESRADRIERVSSEIASASLFVSDPAGGQNNLRFPHKQFYEYFIAKAGWLILYNKSSLVARWLGGNLSKSKCCDVIMSEPASAKYLSEMIGDFYPFRQIGTTASCYMGAASSLIYGLASKGIWPIRFTTKASQVHLGTMSI